MTAGAPLQRTTTNVWADAKPFLRTHRAASVCSREIRVVSETLAAGATALHAEGLADTAVIRQSPSRCIVQLGPVAITAAWLCGTHASIEDGELLVIVWRGVVAPPMEHDPEHAPVRGAARTATAIWEQSFRPVASSQDTWRWEAEGDGSAGCESVELAKRCVALLRRSHARHR
jgi:hypothetical protein